MIELNVSKEQIERAKKRAKPISNLKNSVMEGKSTIYGTLGEILVEDFFREKRCVKKENTFDYDLKIDNYRIEVKSKKTTVTPKEHYTCTVFCFNDTQNCDFYFFTRVMQDFSKGWILGYLSREKFHKIATKRFKGVDYDGKKTISDCLNVKISDLTKFKEN